jgi:hypothetical protein
MIININDIMLVNTDNITTIRIPKSFINKKAFDVVADFNAESGDWCNLLTNVSHKRASQELVNLWRAWGRGEPVYVIEQEDDEP